MTRRIILAVTGASGALYVREFLGLMREQGVEVHGLISDAGRQVMRLELACSPEELGGDSVRWYPVTDFTAPMASGSARFDGMVILPCTMGTLAAVANGLSANLIHRAADVMLKERRTLLLAVRETPLNRHHLTNMLAAHDAGAVICPPLPAFYHLPADFTGAARDFACRLAALLGIPVAGAKSWSGPE